MSTLAGRLWNRLSDSACEILQPFLTSLYSRNDKQPALAVPIFKASPDMTFQQWISDWCCHLISKVGFDVDLQDSDANYLFSPKVINPLISVIRMSGTL